MVGWWLGEPHERRWVRAGARRQLWRIPGRLPGGGAASRDQAGLAAVRLRPVPGPRAEGSRAEDKGETVAAAAARVPLPELPFCAARCIASSNLSHAVPCTCRGTRGWPGFPGAQREGPSHRHGAPVQGAPLPQWTATAQALGFALSGSLLAEEPREAAAGLPGSVRCLGPAGAQGQHLPRFWEWTWSRGLTGSAVHGGPSPPSQTWTS